MYNMQDNTIFYACNEVMSMQRMTSVNILKSS